MAEGVERARPVLRSREPFRFDPLPDSSRYFRLLRISASSDDIQPVSCNLVTFPLDDAPEYEALSYVWGRHDTQHQIYVDGRSFAVWHNLNDALKRLRTRFHDRWLWIDDLCINMDDLEERGAQVTAMKTVFGQARRVIVWLGEPLSDWVSPIAALDELMNKQVWNRSTPKLLKDYSKTFSNAWFTRVWAIQEYVLAREVLFLWGADSANPADLIGGVNFVTDLLSQSDRVHSMLQEEIEEIRSNLRGFQYFDWVRNKYPHQADDAAAFGRLVATAQELQASNQKDHVYGLLALAPSYLRKSFQPDYALPTETMYMKLAEAMALTSRTQIMLNGIAEDYLNSDDVAAPAWLPGWIDELFLRVSDIGRTSDETNSVQKAVIECLEIIAVPTQFDDTDIELSSTEKAVYAKILQDVYGMLQDLIYGGQPIQGPALTGLETRQTGLYSVEENFSDSGYSTASSYGELVSDLADGIAAHLLDHSLCQRLLVAAAEIEKRDDTLARRLRPCIKKLGYDLDVLATDSIELSVAQELKRHAPFIVRALVSRIRNANIAEEEEHRMQRDSRIARLLDEQTSRVQSRLRNVSVTEDGMEKGISRENTRQDVFPQQQMSKTALDQVKEFISSDEAFLPFLHLLSRMIYSSPLEMIQAEIVHEVPDREQTLKASFEIEWDFAAFTQREDLCSEGRVDYGRLSTLLVISGTAKSSYATNCEIYLTWRWPETSVFLLRALCGDSGPEVVDNPLTEASKPRLNISSRYSEHGNLVIDATGERRHVIDVAQQLAWLTAACRQAAEEARNVSVSDVLFFRTKHDTFHISTLPLKPLAQHDEACWIPLFPGTVIAHEYPIPERGDENGMELPFHLMTTLAGPLYPMKYDGGFCLKAHSRILFPTAVTKSKILCIQWHFDTKPGAHLTPPWHASQSDDWKWLKMLLPQQLANARCFLGYCRRVVVDLGTEKPEEYHKNIRYSGLNNESHVPAVGMPSSITVSTAALLPIVLSTAIPIIKTKALSLSADVERDYQDVLYEAQYRPVILYDSGESDSRGWMVPLSCVLLHMVHTWSANRKTFTNDFPHLDQSSNAGEDAHDVLLANWNFVVRKSYSTDSKADKDKVVRDLVMQFWKNICQKQYEDLLAMTQAEYSYEFQVEKLYGWEYMDIVDNKHSLRKQVTFKTSWGLFREDCIVLFGQNLGEVIRPASDVTLCSKWRPVRTRRMYLTATIQCLTTLAREKGGGREILTSFRLTDKGYWHCKPRELFLDCPHAAGEKCRKRPQYLRSNAPRHTEALIPPSEGAVVFGRNFLEKPNPTAQVSETGHQSSERPSSFNLVARARRSFQRSIDRAATRSTTAGLSHEDNHPLLSDESAEDS